MAYQAGRLRPPPLVRGIGGLRDAGARHRRRGGPQAPTELFGVEETEPIDFFVYADSAGLYGAMGPGTPENVGGQAHPDIRTMFASIAPGDVDDPWVADVVPHELTHLVFATAVENDYHQPPRWLNEGVADLPVRRLHPEWRATTQAAISGGTLVPLARPGQPVPDDERQLFYQAYGISTSAVDYLDPDVRKRRDGRPRPLLRRAASATTRRSRPPSAWTWPPSRPRGWPTSGRPCRSARALAGPAGPAPPDWEGAAGRRGRRARRADATRRPIRGDGRPVATPARQHRAVRHVRERHWRRRACSWARYRRPRGRRRPRRLGRPRPARRRGVTAGVRPLVRSARWQVTGFVALLVLGFLIAAQVASQTPEGPLHDPGAPAAGRDRPRPAGTAGDAQGPDRGPSAPRSPSLERRVGGQRRPRPPAERGGGGRPHRGRPDRARPGPGSSSSSRTRPSSRGRRAGGGLAGDRRGPAHGRGGALAGRRGGHLDQRGARRGPDRRRRHRRLAAGQLGLPGAALPGHRASARPICTSGCPRRPGSATSSARGPRATGSGCRSPRRPTWSCRPTPGRSPCATPRRTAASPAPGG